MNPDEQSVSRELRREVDGAQLAAQVTGSGVPVVLLHGFPHTRAVWDDVTVRLVPAGCLVVAPDLRGIGESEPTETGYDAATLARDVLGMLDALGLPSAHVVGFDLGAAPAFALATLTPDRVRSLTIVEAAIGGLPGAERLLAGGGPWWFGFHQAPGGLAEDVVGADAERYVRYFLESGSRRGVPEELAARFVEAYRGRERLRAAFEHYRAMPANAAANRAWAARGRLTMPVTTIGAGAVQDLTARQLAPVADDLVEHMLADAGHIVPVDAPTETAHLILATIARGESRRPAPA